MQQFVLSTEKCSAYEFHSWDTTCLKSTEDITSTHRLSFNTQTWTKLFILKGGKLSDYPEHILHLENFKYAENALKDKG